MGIGIPELILILIVILLFVGPKKLPAAGAALGMAFREFTRAFSGKAADKDEKADEEKSDKE